MVDAWAGEDGWRSWRTRSAGLAFEGVVAIAHGGMRMLEKYGVSWMQRLLGAMMHSLQPPQFRGAHNASVLVCMCVCGVAAPLMQQTNGGSDAAKSETGVS